METFTIRDLREKTGDLVRGAEGGKLSIITKHGRPVFLALPFDETLVRGGLTLALAMHLFEAGVVGTGGAAKLAGKTVPEFIDELAAAGKAAVRYTQAEFDDELARVAEVTRR